MNEHKLWKVQDCWLDDDTEYVCNCGIVFEGYEAFQEHIKEASNDG